MHLTIKERSLLLEITVTTIILEHWAIQMSSVKQSANEKFEVLWFFVLFFRTYSNK